MKLENKIAVVTGGAMGNGAGIVEVFAKYKARVIIFDYSDKIASAIQDFRNKGFYIRNDNGFVAVGFAAEFLLFL